jgi:hypothetical protein
MEAPRRAANRQKQRSRRFWIIVAIAVLVVLIVIIVPTAVILSGRQSSKGLASSIILPLYIYPMQNSWEPLYNACVFRKDRPLKHRKELIFHRLNATSDTNYTIIVNPESGPGNDSLPNDDYLPAIQRLNAFSNARTVGYVRTNYTSRPLADVLQDISTYSGWANGSQGIQMHGIFFDEAVHVYSAEAAEYMKEANDAVRAATGLAGEKTVRITIVYTSASECITDNRDRSSITLELSQMQDLSSIRLTSQSSLSNLTKSTDRSRTTSTRCRETDPSTASWCTRSRQRPTSKNSSTA